MKKLLLVIVLVVLSTVCFSQDKIKLANEQIKSEIVSLKKIQKQTIEDFKKAKKAHKTYMSDLKTKIKTRENFIKSVKEIKK